MHTHTPQAHIYTGKPYTDAVWSVVYLVFRGEKMGVEGRFKSCYRSFGESRADCFRLMLLDRSLEIYKCCFTSHYLFFENSKLSPVKWCL